MAGQGANGLVAWAVEAGVAKGTSATTFAPNARLQTEHIYDLSRQNYYIGGVDFTRKFVYNNNGSQAIQIYYGYTLAQYYENEMSQNASYKSEHTYCYFRERFGQDEEFEFIKPFHPFSPER